MPGGILIERQYVLIGADGAVVIDWGEDLFQDVHTGDFFHLNAAQIAHLASEDDMLVLKRSGKVSYYDSQKAFFLGLPDRPLEIID